MNCLYLTHLTQPTQHEPTSAKMAESNNGCQFFSATASRPKDIPGLDRCTVRYAPRVRAVASLHLFREHFSVALLRNPITPPKHRALPKIALSLALCFVCRRFGNVARCPPPWRSVFQLQVIGGLEKRMKMSHKHQIPLQS